MRAARLAAALALLAAPAGAHAAALSGTVVDRAGRPVEYANVSLPQLGRGAVTDERGRFSIDVAAGAVTLRVSQIGYLPRSVAVTVAEAGAEVRVVLEEEPVPVAEVEVAASSFGTTGKSEGAVLRRMDVLLTPGGAGDVFQSLRALPGINAPDEGAALYVRGGDPRETLIRIDGGEIGHPYHYEGASGGLFSAFDSYMLESAFFSSGGFSARYGRALSGVLDIQTRDPLDLRTVSLGANLVGAGASTSWALVPGRLSLVSTARFSAIDLLERLYGSPSEYVAVPSSRDGAARLIYRYSPAGRASLLYLGSGDRVGVVSNHLNFEGEYAQASRNHFAALQVQHAVGERLALKGQLAGQLYRTRWSFGPLAMREDERHAHLRVDGVFAASAAHELSFGAGLRRPDEEIRGRSPDDSTDWAPGAPVRTYGTRSRLWDAGLYVEDKLRVVGPLYATLGARLDHASVPGAWSWDPRAALAWRVDDRQTVRLAAGRYHQLPDARYLDPVYGNPRLGVLAADHAIAGWEWKTPDGHARLEAYHKRYRGLVTQSAERFFDNGGSGVARGCDAFLQGRRGRFSGWVSYGYLDARRREGDDPREVPSAYGVRHSLTLVAMASLTPRWQAGARYGHSSGRPYTPVVARRFDPDRRVWRPVFGENHSGEMPDTHRLDVRLTRLFSLPAGLGVPASSVCVLYVEVLNALDTENVLRWVWNADYTERHADLSYFSRRMAVAGLALTW